MITKLQKLSIITLVIQCVDSGLAIPDVLVYRNPKIKTLLLMQYQNQNYLSIKILRKFGNIHFSFKIAGMDDVVNELKRLDISKAYFTSDIPTNNVDLFPQF